MKVAHNDDLCSKILLQMSQVDIASLNASLNASSNYGQLYQQLHEVVKYYLLN